MKSITVKLYAETKQNGSVAAAITGTSFAKFVHEAVLEKIERDLAMDENGRVVVELKLIDEGNENEQNKETS